MKTSKRGQHQLTFPTSQCPKKYLHLLLTLFFHLRILQPMNSVILYTLHKAGSTFINGLLDQICRQLQIEHHTENNDRYFQQISEASWKAYIESVSNTACFGPVRALTQTPVFPANLDQHTILLHLRDPRDILTSMFFSKAFSHRVLAGRFDISPKQRLEMQKSGIDHFVLENAQKLVLKYDLLYQVLKDRPNTTIIHYEEMVLNFPAWLDQVLKAFAPIKVPANKKRNLLLPQSMRRLKLKNTLLKINQNAFDVDQEDVLNHKRKVTPGDHRDKLKPETIATLNKIFASYIPAGVSVTAGLSAA